MEAERQFGPVMPSTNDATFDFTLLFEESILTALPLGIAGKQKRKKVSIRTRM